MLRKEEREGTEVMIVGKDTVMVRKKYDRHAKASMKDQAVVIAASELNRLRKNAKLVTKEEDNPEEIEQKQREEEALAERQAKSIARKEKIRQMEEERKRNAIQSENAKEHGAWAFPALQFGAFIVWVRFGVSDARGPKGGVLERAKQMLDEDMDDVKHMNQMMLYSKIVTIRDAQIQEKRMVQSEREEEDDPEEYMRKPFSKCQSHCSKERHLDAMMEIERLKALKMYEVIIEQIKAGQAQRMKEEEHRDQERAFVLKQIQSLKAEEVEQQQQKKLAAERLMQEVNEANSAAMKIKEEKMLAEKLEEQTRVCREPAGDKKMRNK
eukprot:g14748.t1